MIFWKLQIRRCNFKFVPSEGLNFLKHIIALLQRYFWEPALDKQNMGCPYRVFCWAPKNPGPSSAWSERTLMMVLHPWKMQDDPGFAPMKNIWLGRYATTDLNKIRWAWTLQDWSTQKLAQLHLHLPYRSPSFTIDSGCITFGFAETMSPAIQSLITKYYREVCWQNPGLPNLQGHHLPLPMPQSRVSLEPGDDLPTETSFSAILLPTGC